MSHTKNVAVSRNYRNMRSLASEAKFYEGYSRFIPELNRHETWNESVDRVMKMHDTFFTKKGKMSDALKREMAKAREGYINKSFLGAQRALQFGGDQLLKHHARLYNCCSSYADRPEFFGETFYMLLCGCGVGFSVQKQHIEKLPAISLRDKQAKTHVIDDSIEGWATALDVLLSSYFVGGGKHPEYEGRKVYFDYTNIRAKGEMISGGFAAPGPEPLMLAMNKIENMLNKIAHTTGKLSPINVYDIVMHSADAVIAGGVRRSATICLFSHDDEEMAKAKTGDWYRTNPQRGRSNNSAVLIRGKVTKDEFESLMTSVQEFGEPGFYFVDDPDIMTNPCVEIGMYPKTVDGRSGFQGCNLVEINGSYCDTPEKFYEACEAAAIMGTLQAAYTDFKFLSPTSKEIFDREALIGVSITGWTANPKVLLNKEIVRKGVEIVRETNIRVAKIIGINPAARLTCVKPSGNASVLLGTPSGIHGEHAPMYIRNTQVNKESPVGKFIKSKFPEMVEESRWSANGTDWVISYPVISTPDSIFKYELLGVKQLEIVKFAQENWVIPGTNLDFCVNKAVRHNVSNTIQVDDWREVSEYIWKHHDIFAGISLLGMSGDKSYVQAPFTEVLTEDKIIEKYGSGAMFASGLIVDAIHVFDDLWFAINSVKFGVNDGDKKPMQLDWVRRFHKFADNFFDGDIEKTELCLKDVHLLHRWSKIQNAIRNTEFSWEEMQSHETLVDADTLAAAACQGGACEI